MGPTGRRGCGRACPRGGTEQRPGCDAPAFLTSSGISPRRTTAWHRSPLRTVEGRRGEFSAPVHAAGVSGQSGRQSVASAPGRPVVDVAAGHGQFTQQVLPVLEARHVRLSPSEPNGTHQAWLGDARCPRRGGSPTPERPPLAGGGTHPQGAEGVRAYWWASRCARQDNSPGCVRRPSARSHRTISHSAMAYQCLCLALRAARSRSSLSRSIGDKASAELDRSVPYLPGDLTYTAPCVRTDRRTTGPLWGT